MAPFVVNRVSGIFAANERVVLEGEWLHGHFTITPVGATNVGMWTQTKPVSAH